MYQNQWQPDKLPELLDTLTAEMVANKVRMQAVSRAQNALAEMHRVMRADDDTLVREYESARLYRINKRANAIKRQETAVSCVDNGLPRLSINERDLIANHRTIAAIKSYRDRNNVDLRTAKSAIDDYIESLRSSPT